MACGCGPLIGLLCNTQAGLGLSQARIPPTVLGQIAPEVSIPEADPQSWTSKFRVSLGLKWRRRFGVCAVWHRKPKQTSGAEATKMFQSSVMFRSRMVMSHGDGNVGCWPWKKFADKASTSKAWGSVCAPRITDHCRHAGTAHRCSTFTVVRHAVSCRKAGFRSRCWISMPVCAGLQWRYEGGPRDQWKITNLRAPGLGTRS